MLWMPKTRTNLDVPASAGIGLRSPHIEQFLRRRPAIGWLEVHAENYMGRSANAEVLDVLRTEYPLSVHGVGLSLGSMNGIDRDHLERLRAVCDRYNPSLVSEHLAWSSAGGTYLNDLLPLRYCERALDIVSDNVDLIQQRLGRQILVENLSAYVALADSTMSEAEFLAELVERTGCGLLLDVNNVHVSANNLGFDAWKFITTLPADAIGEIHLAGHAINHVGNDTILIDDHGSRVPAEVWALYSRAIALIGRRPTLIEWDSALPPLEVLLGEAHWADMLACSVEFDRMRGDKQSSVAVNLPADRGLNLPALAACHAIPSRHGSEKRHAYA